MNEIYRLSSTHGQRHVCLYPRPSAALGNPAGTLAGTLARLQRSVYILASYCSERLSTPPPPTTTLTTRVSGPSSPSSKQIQFAIARFFHFTALFSKDYNFGLL